MTRGEPESGTPGSLRGSMSVVRYPPMSAADIVILILLPGATASGMVAAYTARRGRRVAGVGGAIFLGLVAIIVTVVDLHI